MLILFSTGICKNILYLCKYMSSQYGNRLLLYQYWDVCNTRLSSKNTIKVLNLFYWSRSEYKKIIQSKITNQSLEEKKTFEIQINIYTQKQFLIWQLLTKFLTKLDLTRKNILKLIIVYTHCILKKSQFIFQKKVRPEKNYS